MSFDDLDPERLRLRLGAKWHGHGPDALPAWVAEMDYPIAEPIRDVIGRALDNDDFGYPIWPHEMGLPEAFCERMRERYGWSPDSARVEALSDVVQGLYVSLLAYSAPGDGVLVQTPVYPPFLASVRETGRRLLASPLVDTGDHFAIDFEHLAHVGRDARVLMLCHPHNPTGRVFTRVELELLGELALERDWLVLSDEIHADLTYAGPPFIPFAALGPEIAARTVTLTSATKAFNIAGLRCAIAHFGTAALRDRFNAACLPHARGGLGILGQHCTKAAWQHGGAWLDSVKSLLDDQRHFLLAELGRRLPEAVVRLPEATYLAWLDLRQLELPAPPAAFFRERARVVLSHGATFGAGFEGYARLNFATSRRILTEILERIVSAARDR
jgi:cystathionine beta-lyase